ncbi:carboxypeptidase-like regulatory domain-containing protein [Granulicella sp. S156]|jgi:Carboxypeptidase regulatory-like domain|uniref:carboxypeptidase-like regulatory domain-containing protein n=1 Tax=Granulicella sp. S156 TaxID=1747224 RepID=UPI00131E757C|nr:carboxypeptidase-like regulatory domain-containing protein [Granulicella sp. S156]
MSGMITGHLLDAVTGETLSKPQISLIRHGIREEDFTQADELGRFSFHSLPAGRYSLGFHDARYAPLYREVLLEEGETVENLQISLTPGAFIKGRILDEEGVPPRYCHFTLIRAGNRGERSGYISDSGDHKVDEDGCFCSPPLSPGSYSLRFVGILQKPLSAPPQPARPDIQQRIFDFLYPNAQDIKDAGTFDVQAGQIKADLELRVPRPIWLTVRGKVTGELPEDIANISVHFTRDVGMLDDFGSLGVKVDSSRNFEAPVQTGRYRVFVWEMAPPLQNGYTRMTKELASSIELTVGTCDVEGFEVQV